MALNIETNAAVFDNVPNAEQSHSHRLSHTNTETLSKHSDQLGSLFRNDEK